MAKNKVRFNLKNVHYAPITDIDAAGVPTYGKPIHIPGAVNMSMSAEGSTSPFYADGIVYYTTSANNGYSGDLEMALITDNFRKDILKEQEDTPSGVMVENSYSEPQSFALLFQFDGDQTGTRHVMFNCTASRPNVEGSTTTDSKEPNTESLTLTATPLQNGMVKARTGENTTQMVYDNWFDQVWMVI